MTGEWAAAAGALLDPGERLLVAEAIEPAKGDFPLPPLPPPVDSPPLSRARRVGLTLMSLVSPHVSLPGLDALEVLMYGRAARGRPGSSASEMFYRHMKTSGPRTCVLAVSDRRLLVCVTPKKNFWADETKDVLELLMGVPRTEVTGASIWRPRFRRRLRIDFADGSWGTFVTELDEPLDKARLLAAALTRSP